MYTRLPVTVAFAIALAVSFVACSSSETSVTAPTASRCDVAVTTTASSFTATGGNGTLNVATARDCTWTISTDASWVSIAGSRSGQGDAAVDYSVSANPVPAPRSGNIVVGTRSVALSQAGAPCRFSLSRSGDSIGAAGGRMAFDLTTLAGCSWTASSSTGWITISSGQSGSASGSIALTVAANTGARRVGQVTAGGQIYTVTQDALPAPEPTPAPAPSPAPSPSPGPGPSPTPTPTPTPPGSQTVEVSGPVLLASGKCPDIDFLVGIQRVTADKATDYRKGKCGDVRIGASVTVTGTATGGSVYATTIEINKNDH
jgi:hypothetical protein